jgi:hypothetical protein
MAVRKSPQEEMVVTGNREDWLKKCGTALESQGFTKIATNSTLFQIEANYKKVTIWGEILITLTPAGNDTKITAKSTTNVDNIYALFTSSNKKILSEFKKGLG